MSIRRPSLALASLVVCLVSSLHAVRADEPAVIAKGQRLIAAREQAIHNCMQFGTQYRGCRYNYSVRDALGNVGLRYQFFWGTDGETVCDFYFDMQGRFLRVGIVRFNGILNQPFVGLNATLKLGGAVIWNALQGRLNEDDRRLLRTLIDNADAQGILELDLRTSQLFTR